ncbi:hypothetical protein [Afifella pfennigii]|uniref:hypothetical protein n=1 Tax=Afifella pfennigii TaxID=209897 RepID=UPI00068BFBA9|nr:hypothetical protein [Afifella pfennigii]
MASTVDPSPLLNAGRPVLRRRAALALACLAAAALAFLAGDPAPRLAADAETARLLRGMALIKAVFVLAGFALLWWRLKSPVATPVLAGYVALLALMAGAAVLVWQLSFLAFTSLVFHAALIGLVLLAWRDDGLDKGVLAGR